MSQACAVVRVVTPTTSLAVVALSEPMTRFINELLPTPVSPATTTLRDESEEGLGKKRYGQFLWVSTEWV